MSKHMPLSLYLPPCVLCVCVSLSCPVCQSQPWLICLTKSAGIMVDMESPMSPITCSMLGEIPLGTHTILDSLLAAFSWRALRWHMACILDTNKGSGPGQKGTWTPINHNIETWARVISSFEFDMTPYRVHIAYTPQPYIMGFAINPGSRLLCLLSVLRLQHLAGQLWLLCSFWL